MKSFYSLLAASLIFSACSKSDNARLALDDNSPVIELPVTAQVSLPEKGVEYAFVPNDVAQWLSQIIILSEDGDLYQATADTQMAKPVAGPKMSSIIGLNRPKAPGMFLGVNKDTNRIHAFVESNDAGDFEHIGEIKASVLVQSFCQTSETATETVQAINADGTAQSYSVAVTDRDVSLTNAGDSGPCDRAVDLPNGELSIMLSVSQDSEIIVNAANNEPARVKVTNGITIPGVKNSQGVYVATENFGGPFNNGIVLISDADEPRFVVISADFARKTLGD